MQINLLKLHCTLNNEFDKDDVFLKCEGEKIWPIGTCEAINSGEKIPIYKEFSCTSDKDLVIELWDYDLFSKNYLLGRFIMAPYEEDKDSTCFNTMKLEREGSMASYLLEWEIVN